MLSFHPTEDFVEVLWSARIAFSKRSWPYAVALAVPWLMTQGQRCVTRLWTAASHRRSRSAYYRFLSDGKFRRQALFRSLFDLVVRTFRVERALVVADDTLCPKWGRRIFGTASFFDPTPRPRPGFTWGHNWVVLALVVEVRGVPLALPFWIDMYRPEGSCEASEFRTRVEIVADALRLVRTWFPGPVLVVADGAYNNASLMTPMADLGIDVVSRLRSDARLRRDPPARPRGSRGRPPRYGAPLSRLRTLARSSSGFRRVRVTIYRARVTLLVRVLDAWWPACGRKLRVVIVKDPRGRGRTTFLSTTDLASSAEQIVETFASRWSVEQLFSDAKIHLGLDSAEVRGERSVLRHAALSVALITWVQVWHHRRHPAPRAPAHATHVSFGRKLRELRERFAAQTLFAASPGRTRSPRNANALAALFAHAATAA